VSQNTITTKMSILDKPYYIAITKNLHTNQEVKSLMSTKK